jgi:hypothetical protein
VIVIKESGKLFETDAEGAKDLEFAMESSSVARRVDEVVEVPAADEAEAKPESSVEEDAPKRPKQRYKR